jgi:hypothetical protein
MNFGFHTPIAAWLALLAVPLIIAYFLKLRRPRQEVPSLALWRQVLADQRVNAPFQRFRRHLLLLLQLLALGALVLAAMQPFSDSGASASARRAVIVDVSASMGSLRVPGGKTRLDEAKAKVQALIDQLAPGQELCLIAMATEARRVTGFTDDRRELTRALAELQPLCAASEPKAALRLAAAIGRTTPFPRAVLVSDGNLPAAVDLDLPFALDYVRVDGGGPNVGVSAAAARRRPGGGWDIAVTVTGTTPAPLAASTLELRVDGAVAVSRPVLLDADGAMRTVFRLDGGKAMTVSLDLVHDGFDALSADDHAWLGLPEQHPVRVWVAPGLVWWRRALEAQADSRLLLVDDGADLVVSDQAADVARALRVGVGVGVVPPDLAGRITVSDPGTSTVVDAVGDDPLLLHVGLTDLLIAQGVAWAVGSGDSDAEAAGYTVLVHGDHGPLLLSHPAAGRNSYWLTFASDRSTLSYRLGFPVLAGNLVARTLALGGQAEIQGAPTGTLPPIAVRGPVTVTGPDGSHAGPFAPDADGEVGGIAAPLPGMWTVHGAFADGVGDLGIGVGLLNAGESRLNAVDKLQVREVAVTASAAPGAGEWRFWPWLVVLALLVLTGEWAFAHRAPVMGKE